MAINYYQIHVDELSNVQPVAGFVFTSIGKDPSRRGTLHQSNRFRSCLQVQLLNVPLLRLPAPKCGAFLTPAEIHFLGQI